MSQSREKLVKELSKLVDDQWHSLTVEQCADFILADRIRVVEPYEAIIKKIDKILRKSMYVNEAYDAKEKALEVLTDFNALQKAKGSL